ncbi:Uncharacterised protein [Mycobacteroides abscessus subsp. abscessus]|nr:Uncharacterised protein [Mycobacteroides abscessus subsp. abscessus]
MSTKTPSAIMNGTTEKPNGVTLTSPIVSAPRGLMKPQVPACSSAITMSPSPATDNAVPTQSIPPGSAFSSSAMARTASTTRMHTTVSAANTTRQVSASVTHPPINGPAAAPAAAIPPRAL